MIRAALLWLALFGTAFAQDWPALYDVTGVAAGDVLNVRAAPNTGSDIIGALAPDAKAIEVVKTSSDAKWGLVNVGERAGWASLRFLRVTQDPQWPPHLVSCFGTEPFWSMRAGNMRHGLGATISILDAGDLSFLAPDWMTSANILNRASLLAKGTGSRQILAVFEARACTDGMSDQAYGISVEVVMQSTDTRQHLSGCCSLRP